MLGTQGVVIVNHTVMRQSEGTTANRAWEGMIVIVHLLIPLGSHTGMTHKTGGIMRQMKPQLMSRLGSLEDPQLTARVVSDPRSVSPPYLTLGSQYREQLGALLNRKGTTAVKNTKQTAHHASSSVSTGSLR